MPIQAVTNISVALLAQIMSFVTDRISPADLPIMALFFSMVLETIMNSAPGTPLPLTSAITSAR